MIRVKKKSGKKLKNNRWKALILVQTLLETTGITSTSLSRKGFYTENSVFIKLFLKGLEEQALGWPLKNNPQPLQNLLKEAVVLGRCNSRADYRIFSPPVQLKQLLLLLQSHWLRSCHLLPCIGATVTTACSEIVPYPPQSMPANWCLVPSKWKWGPCTVLVETKSLLGFKLQESWENVSFSFAFLA